MASPENMGGVSSEEVGRDWRLEPVFEAQRKLGQAQEEFSEAQLKLEEAKHELIEAYAGLAGQILMTEGVAYAFQDPVTKDVKSYSSGGRRIDRQNMRIVGANSNGVFIHRLNLAAVQVMHFEDIHHPQSAMPSLEI